MSLTANDRTWFKDKDKMIILARPNLPLTKPLYWQTSLSLFYEFAVHCIHTTPLSLWLSYSNCASRAKFIFKRLFERFLLFTQISLYQLSGLRKKAYTISKRLLNYCFISHCSKYFIIPRNIFRFLFHGNSSGQEIKGRMQTLKFFQKTFVKNAKTFNCIFFCRVMLTIFYGGIVIKLELRDV